jgi:cytoskeletal protein CcmA (bactofilin family)
MRQAQSIRASRQPSQGVSMSTSNERMSVFGPTLRFKGELKAQEDIKIEGRIECTIHHQQRVHVGSKGEVVATVNAQSIDVDGRVQGDMSAKKSIKVSQSAVVRGNIRAPSVSITEGANFNGGVTMESNAGSLGTTSSSSKPA